MKKYFSLIAVAMIAVSSVFTSCSKDGSGSSYSQEIPSLTNSMETPAENSRSTATTVEEWAKKLSNTTSISVCVETANGESIMSTDVQNIPDQITEMVKNKFTTAGVLADISGTMNNISIDFEGCEKSDVVAAIKSITPDDLKSIVESNDNVKAVYLTPAWNNDCSKIVWTR